MGIGMTHLVSHRHVSRLVDRGTTNRGVLRTSSLALLSLFLIPGMVDIFYQRECRQACVLLLDPITLYRGLVDEPALWAVQLIGE